MPKLIATRCFRGPTLCQIFDISLYEPRTLHWLWNVLAFAPISGLFAGLYRYYPIQGFEELEDPAYRVVGESGTVASGSATIDQRLGIPRFRSPGPYDTQHTVLTVSAAMKSAADFGVILTVAIEIRQGEASTSTEQPCITLVELRLSENAAVKE